MNSLGTLKGRTGHRQLGKPLEIIGNAIREMEKGWGKGKIPPITVLVVRKGPGQPMYGGHHFIASFLGCSEAEVGDFEKKDWDSLSQKIYDFRRWGEVLALCDLGDGSHEGEAE
ncbi:MAG: hypothetical protein MPK06_03690 [Alphaproteobacteria bacterium]|nr:hypothetical protein [Alphaproteobacteria bacterium]MDA8003809.1 hypothetical protein [Alphaproteobacteria bacterium]MDA8005630.1 hypothetical protein [Alphaproteobacteria bacterium]MDA8013348.1 hypothetical protein [Alphaproteobacteria bacterium]